jgi:SAM-dependent methyltransferase
MLTALKRKVPLPWKEWIKAQVRGYSRLYCPICHRYAADFKTFGLVPRRDAQCPHCGAVERHRLVWLFFQRKTDLLDGRPKRLLHFAPEAAIAKHFRTIDNLDAVTADLFDPNASISVDITHMPSVPDASFDFLYCSHVLEHVADDRKAIKECARVLKPEGRAVFMVPITAKVTYENPSITDPRERERLFGQHDHVRRYGPDFLDRLKSGGFDVRVFSVKEIAGLRRRRYALRPNEGPVYYCNLSRHAT